MSKREAKNIALMRVVKQVGGQSALADEINADPIVVARKKKTKVRQGHVWAWLYRAGEVPGKYVIPVERISSRFAEKTESQAVTRSELAPDIYPSAEKAA